MLYRESIQKFLSYLEGKDYADRTIRDYYQELNHLRRWLEDKRNGPIYLDEIILEDYEMYMLYLKQEGSSASHRNKILYILRSFYSFIYKKGWGEDLARGLEAAKVRKKEREYLTPEEMDRVLAAMGNPLIRYATIFMYHTGVRMGECLNLQRKDLDFHNKIVYIRQGKGNKDRQVAMSTDLETSLKYYLESIRPEVGHDTVFVSGRSGGLSSAHYNRVLGQAVEEAGINKEITAHCIRHSTAVALVRKGVDLPTIQRILGHENLATTSIYLHSDLSDMREAMEGIYNTTDRERREATWGQENEKGLSTTKK